MEKDNLKLYPLTSAQKMHFFTLKYCPKKQVLNIGISTTIEIDINFDVLKESIYEAYDRCESMRLRFTEDEKGECLQYIIPKETRNIEYFDFRHWKYEDAENEMRKWTSVPFEGYDTPRNRIVMIAMPDGYNGIYLLCDHMTMDAQSIIVFVQDIIQIYCSKVYNTEYPKALESYIKALEKDLKYYGSKAEQKDREYWNNFIKSSEAYYADINGTERLNNERISRKNPFLRACVNSSNDIEAAIANFHLESEATQRILDFCKAHEIPVVCFIIAALRTYISKMNNNQSDISIQSTVSRRATLLEKRSGGTRIHFFPCRTVINSEEIFIDAIRKIQDAQNKMFMHANFNPIEFMGTRAKYYNNQGQTYECMSLTYQPLSQRKKELGDLKYKSSWYSNGVAASPLYLTVMHRSIDNGFDFAFEYQKSRFQYDDLEKLYYYLCKIMFSVIDNCYSTVGDIIKSI